MKKKSPYEEEEPRDEATLCIKYMLVLFIVIFFMMGASILGVSLWTVIDKNYFSVISGNLLFSVAAYLLVGGGVLMVVLSIFGCCGMFLKNMCMLLVFGLSLAVIFLVLVIGGTLAGIYRTQLTENVRLHMEDTLKFRYGVDTNIQYNQAITIAWDKVQTGMSCCAVQDSRWDLYRDSLWFKRSPGEVGMTKPYVPKSCCVQGGNTDQCQFSKDRPPGSLIGPPNPNLHYRGCFSAGVEFIHKHSDIIIGMAIAFAIFLMSGITFTFCYYWRLISW